MLAEKREKTKEGQEAFAKAQEDHAREVAQFEKDRELLQTLKTGISTKEGQDSGYMQQIQGELEPYTTNQNSREEKGG